MDAPVFLRYAVHRRLVFEWGLPETQVDTYFSVMAGIEYAYSTFAMAHQPARVWWIEFPVPTCS